MSTTDTFTFSPSDTASPPFSFQFNINGDSYSGQCTWNVAGQRWYVQIYDQYHTLLINHPMISSPVASPINLAPGIFRNTVISYSETDSIIRVVTTDATEVATVESVIHLGLALPATISINDVVVKVGDFTDVLIKISDVNITLSAKSATVIAKSAPLSMTIGTATAIGDAVSVTGDGQISVVLTANGGTIGTGGTTTTLTGTADEVNASIAATLFTASATAASLYVTATNTYGSDSGTVNIVGIPSVITYNALSTNGNKIVDSVTGDVVILKSVNWAGAEANNYVPDGLWQVSYKDLIDQIAKWGFNSIRFPYSGDTFNQPQPTTGAINLYALGTGTGEYDNLDFTTNNSATAPVWKDIYGVFDTILKYCAKKGIRAIFDHHRRASGSGGTDGSPTDASYTQSDWEATWVALAKHYSAANGFSNVCGADLHNEPYQLTWKDWVTACNGVIAAIQAVNTDWLMVVEGVGTYDNNSYWWGGQLQGAAVGQYYVSSMGVSNGGTGWATGDTFSFNGGTGTVSAQSAGVVTSVSLITSGPSATDPTNSASTAVAITGSGTGLVLSVTAIAAPDAIQPTLVTPNKLVYSPHEYGQSVGAQNWLETTTQTVANYPDNLPAIWDSFWGYIAKQNIAPIWIGEFGGKFGVNGTGAADSAQVNAKYEKQWVSGLVDYIKSYGINFSYWDLNPNSTDTGGLLQDDWVTPQSTKIALIQPILSE